MTMQGPRGRVVTPPEVVKLPPATRSPFGSTVRALADAPVPLQARWLLRNRDLNPDDVHLDATVRNALQTAFDAGKPGVVRLAQEVARSARTEFEQRIAAGALPAVRYDAYVRGLDAQGRQEHDAQLAKAVADARREGAINGLSPEAIEQDIRRIQVLDPLHAHGYRPFLTHRIDSDYYACRLADLPLTGTAVNAYRDAFVGMVAEITRIVGAAGALGEVQREAIEKSALRAVDAKYDR